MIVKILKIYGMEKIDFILESVHDRKPIAIDVKFKDDGQKKPLVLFVHGFKGFKDWGTFDLVSEYFASKGYIFAKFNLSHNGTTLASPTDFADLDAFGNNNFTIELDDIGTVLDCFFEGSCLVPDVDLVRTYLIGHSRGGGVALLKACEDKRFRKIATWAAIDRIPRYDEQTVEEWRKKGVLYIWNSRTNQNMPLYWQLHDDVIGNAERFDIPKRVQILEQPVLVVHGTNDPTVPVAAAHHLHQQIPHSELMIVEGSGHTFEAYHPYDEDTLPENLQKVVERTEAFFSS